MPLNKIDCVTGFVMQRATPSVLACDVSSRRPADDSMMIGSALASGRSRSRRTSSKPSMPGIMTSTSASLNGLPARAARSNSTKRLLAARRQPSISFPSWRASPRR